MPAEIDTLPPAPLRGRAPDRPRRHGRDLPRDRPRAGPRRGGQGARRAVRGRRRLAGPVQAGGARGRPPLGTPNIVTIFDVGEHDGRPLIVMEYFAGGVAGAATRELARPARPARPSTGSRRRPARSTPPMRPGSCTATSSRANLLLDGRGHVHVADFGIASAAGLDSFTQAGTVLGTAGYLSPEQAKGERATRPAISTASPSSPGSS